MHRRLVAHLIRPPAVFAAAVLGLIVILAFHYFSQRNWQERNDALERQNMELQLRELVRAIATESDDLIGHARALAESEAAAHIIEDAAAAPGGLTEVAAVVGRDVDAVVVVTATHVVRLSAIALGSQFVERPLDRGFSKLLEAVATPGPAPDNRPRVTQIAATVAGDRLAVAWPIASRASPTAVRGWVVVGRSLSPRIAARLARSVTGPLVGRSLAADDARPVPVDVLQAASAASGGVVVTTHVSEADASGNAILRDIGGHPAWSFRVGTARADLRQTAAGPRAADGSLIYGAAGLLALCSVLYIGLQRIVSIKQSTDARYRAIIDQAHDGIVVVDSKTREILDANPAFLSLAGYTAAEARALTLPEVFADGTTSTATVVARLPHANSECAINIQLRRKDGAYVDTEVRCNELDVNGRHALAYVTHDVSLRRKAEQQLIDNQHRLDRMAHHDQLTGLPNRHYLATFLPEALEAASASHTMLGVVFLDLDRFKHINDTRGHETGDRLLQEVARRVRACVRESDVVIRMGGDEFVVVLRNVKSYEEVTLGASRIIESLNGPIVVDQQPLQTTASVGVSMFPRDGQNMVELLKHSDTAMYQAKDRGRNNVQMFSPIMNRKLKHRVSVEASLREALRLKQLDVHYQPFVNLDTRKVVALEALVRWRHPERGMIPADQFIPIAEETGLVVPIGNFVLHRTLQDLSAWRSARVPIVPVSINVAPAQLQRGDLEATISKLLKARGLGPELLQLEMTERAMFDHGVPGGDERHDTLVRLRDIGVKIAIDDFGTGYSSLSYLKHWRVDLLKIDRSFVRDVVSDSNDLAIVSAIVAIARHLNIAVIAEGIEGYQQADTLRKVGCTLGQGFLYARPMPAAQCEKMLRDGANHAEDDQDMLAPLSAGSGI